MMPCDGEEGVMLLPESETHLVVLVVVRLPVPPVEPGHHDLVYDDHDDHGDHDDNDDEDDEDDEDDTRKETK